MDNDKLTEGLSYISTVDRDFSAALKRLGAPAPRIRPQGFETLVSIIVSQQLSTEVAAAIMGKIHARLPHLTPATILLLNTNELRELGLSKRKTEYIRGIAQSIQQGAFDPMALQAMENDEAMKSLIQLRGLGQWSAEIYLMFSLQRQDIFPADDLAIQIALQKLKGLEDKPTAKQAREITRHWSPWLSAGALFLWHYYRGAP